MTHDGVPSPSLFDGLDPALRDCYLAGTCTPEAVRQIEAWIGGDSARRVALAGLRQGVTTPAEYPVFASAAEVAARTTAALAARSHKNSVVGRARHVGRVRRTYVLAEGRQRLSDQPFRRVASYTLAGLAIVGAILALGWQLGISSRTHAHRTLVMSSYTTGNGERANITLPDGSGVSLNVASRLEVPVDFASGNHTVRLVGEALFTVTHHDGAPLTVIAGPATARVLGTSFVVRHYDSDSTTMVAVRNGKVAVGADVVTAARSVEVERGGTMHDGNATAAQFGFVNGVLSLPAMSLPAAIAELNRWYDADIRLADPRLATQQIEGEFVAGSLSDLAEVLQLTIPVRVVREGRMLFLYSQAGGVCGANNTGRGCGR